MTARTASSGTRRRRHLVIMVVLFMATAVPAQADVLMTETIVLPRTSSRGSSTRPKGTGASRLRANRRTRGRSDSRLISGPLECGKG